MPSRRTPTEGAERPAPRRSERLRQQREAAQEVTNQTTQTNPNQPPIAIAIRSHAISTPIRRLHRHRRWAGFNLARIRRAAETVLSAARAAVTSGNRQVVTGRPLSPPPEDGGNAAESTARPSPETSAQNYTVVVPTRGWTSLVSFSVESGGASHLLPPPPTGAESRAMMGRLNRELLDFQKDTPEGCTVEVVDDNMFHWRGSILGPPETPYTGGQFHLDLHFGHKYPFTPPKIFFTTKIFHCNIASNGHICLDILGDEWSPALTVAKVLMSIRSLMADANPDDPLEPTIAHMYKHRRTQHDMMASSWTSLYAKPGTEPPAPVQEPPL